MFAVPAGGPGGKSAMLLRAGFALDAALTPDRNRGLPDHLHLPAGRLVEGEERAALDTGTLLERRTSRRVARLPHNARRTPHVWRGHRRGTCRRGARQLRRRHRADSPGPDHCRRRRPRSRRRRHAVDQRAGAAQRDRRGGRPADGRLRRATDAAAGEGDEHGHAPRGARRGVRRPHGRWPAAVRAAVAGTAVDRHLARRRALRRRRRDGDPGGVRRVPRRHQPGVPEPRAHGRRRHAGAARCRARRRLGRTRDAGRSSLAARASARRRRRRHFADGREVHDRARAGRAGRDAGDGAVGCAMPRRRPPSRRFRVMHRRARRRR